MNATLSRIEFSGLTNLDVLELQNELQPSGIPVEINRAAAAQSPDHRHLHGALATATVLLALTPAVLQVICVWLARRHGGESFREKVTVIDRHGTRRTHEITDSRRESEAPEAGILKELRKAIVLDHSVLGGTDL